MPSELNARTRQKSVPLVSELVASCEGVVVAAHTSGAAKLALSSTSIVYQAASGTSLQLNVNGCVTEAPSAGLASVAAPGTGGGGGGAVSCTVIVRVSDQSPGRPSLLTPRTRQNQVPS